MLTVRNIVERLFPIERLGSDAGDPYVAWPTRRVARGRMTDPYATPPLTPFDVFALVAHLLEISGAYHHINPMMDGRSGPGSSSFRDLPHREVSRRRLEISNSMVAECRSVAALWAKPFAAGNSDKDALLERLDELEGLTDRWTALVIDHADAPVFQRLRRNDKPPTWWRIAHELLMIADEASVGIGFRSVPEMPVATRANSAAVDGTAEEMPWFEQFVVDSTLAEVTAATEGKIHQLTVKGIKSLSTADFDVLCVLPKGRTSAVGCTLRSLSHHLALLPPQGIARGRWYHPMPGPMVPDDKGLNLLLVPFPFELSDTAFESVAGRTETDRSWGFFHVKQTWLPQPGDQNGHLEIVNALDDLLGSLSAAVHAIDESEQVHGIIFPELALTDRIFEDLSPRLKRRFPTLELFISGVTMEIDQSPNSFPVHRVGNFVMVETFRPTITSPMAKLYRQIREKHHRWKLDRHQIDGYDLSGGLNPRYEWWEDLDLLSRRIDFTTFRRKSVLAAMICEDLARVDPCQELLRSVGPNLIVALLMDAPQLVSRWPARYATVLAEDPGSAVLTLTSKALAHRQRRKGRFKLDERGTAIALWRDDFTGRAREISCPDDACGVWLKLWGSQVTDAALDGREDPHGKTWTFGKYEPLIVFDSPHRHGKLLKGWRT